MQDEVQHQEQVISRLLLILEIAKETHGSGKPKQSSLSELQAWSQILDISDEGDVMRGMIEVDRSITTVANMIEAHPDLDPELYLEHFNHNLPKLITPLNPRGHWEQRRALITDAVIKEVQICSAQYFPDTSWQEVPDTAQIKDLLEDINSLSTRLVFLDMDPILKQVVTGYLEEARMAIVMYRINGIDSVKTAMGTATGMIVLNQEEVKESVQKGEESKAWWRDWNGLQQKTADIVKFGGNLKKLASFWTDAGLPPPGG